MPITKRKTPEERIVDQVGERWRDALYHPYLVAMTKFGNYDTSINNITKAVKDVSGWKGASFQDKVFVYVLCSILWRAFGSSFLTDQTYDRLGRHLTEHADEILDKAGLVYHGIFLWDAAKLRRHSKGALLLPKKGQKRPARKKLYKHRQV